MPPAASFLPTAAVKPCGKFALAAARWAAPAGPHLVFVFAIPAAMSEEYLRNVGALARICREPEKTDALLAAATPAEFAGLLDAWLG